MTLRSSSREAHAAARERLDVIARSPEATPESLAALGDDLFAVVDLLDHEIALRRALTDASRAEGARAELVQTLFAGRVGGVAVDLVAGTVRSRWSRPRDLTDTLEELAVEAVAASADRAGALDDVEDELFRFGRVVAGDPALRAALTDRALPAERKTGLVDALLAGRAADATRTLVRRAAVAPRTGSFEDVLEHFAALTSERRARLVARVRVAVPLTEEQRERLRAALARSYGHDVNLNVEIDPDVLGGLEVRIGDELVDGTVASRLDDAKRRLAG